VLKGIHPLIGADLLYVLAAMGHGDELALVDRNFPAASIGKRVVPALGTDVTSLAEVILTLFPLDTFVPEPVLRMGVANSPEDVPLVQKEFIALCEKAERRSIGAGSLLREHFYSRARNAFAVVATSESRPYGCFLLVKGVINDPVD
jgi:L-fucose mutarotase